MATRIQTTIDTYKRLPISEVPSNQPYQTHDNSKAESLQRDQAKADFLSAESADQWPNIAFPRLDIDEMTAYRSMLLGLIGDVEDAPEEVPEASKDATYDALHQKLLEVNRHIAVSRMLGQQSLHVRWLDGEAENGRLRERAARQNLEIFGYPDVARFNWFLLQDRERAISRLDDEKPEMRVLATYFLSATGDISTGELDPPHELDAATREQFKHDLYDIFPGLEDFCTQDFPSEIPVDQSLPYFNRMRDIMNLPADQYEAFFTNKRACEETPRGVSVGLKRSTAFTPRDIIRLAFHEWTHVLRRHNAQLQDSPEKQVASPSNLAFEEAFCVLTERTLVDESYISGVNYYKSVGLQMNLDKTQDTHNLSDMRSFRDVLTIMTLAEVIEKNTIDRDEIEKIKTRLYNQVMRSTRGSALDARDLSYHIGDQKAKESIKNIAELPQEKRQEMIQWYFSAQFDPTQASDARLFAANEIP